MPSSVKKQSFATAGKEEMTVSASEKVSVNVNIATLAQIDLLVDTGFYSSRSDFINQAVREKLQQQQPLIESAAANIRGSSTRPQFFGVQYQTRSNEEAANGTGAKQKNTHQWFLGIQHLSGAEVESMYAEGEKLSLSGYGMLSIGSDCDPEKVYAVFEKINVRGKVVCSDEIRRHYFPDKDGKTT